MTFLLRFLKSAFFPIALVILATLLPICTYYGLFVSSPSEMRISLWDWIFSNATFALAATLALIFAWVCHRRGVPFLWGSKKTTWLLVLFALLWSTIFNRFVLDNWIQIPFSILFLLAFWSIWRGLLGRFAYIVWVPCLLVLLLEYAATHEGFLVNPDNLVQVFATSWHDAKTYMTPWHVVMAVLAVAVSIAAYHFVDRTLRREKRWTLLCSGCFSLTLLLALLRPLEHSLWRGSSLVWPLGDMEVLAFNAARAQYQIIQMQQILKCFPPEGTTGATMDTLAPGTGVVCILHVGESLCAEHLAINGYKRETTPWLSKQAHLATFPDCVACASTTDKAVVGILTNGRRDFMTVKDERYLPSSPSLMDFFSACGFKCSSFLYPASVSSNAAGLFSRQMEFFLRCSKENFIIKGEAWNQLPAIEKYIAENQGTNLCFMINNYGSHAFFEEYDKENPPFVPTRPITPDDDLEHDAEVAAICTNAYDNTVAYTDEYIRRLLEPLKGKPYLYVYVSDHGEYVGQGGYWLRGKTPHDAFYKSSVCQVAFFIIASPEFEALNPHFKQAMEEVRNHQSMSVGHEHVFHTVLGIMGIKTPFYDATLDLSNPQVQPYTGPHPSRGGEPLPGSE